MLNDAMLLMIANVMLHAVHAIIFSVNLAGWAWVRTRLLGFYSLLLTFFSWFVMGVVYGYGYCPLTALHWHVKKLMGEGDLSESYAAYVVQHYLPLHVSAPMVDGWLYGASMIAFCASIYTLLRLRWV